MSGYREDALIANARNLHRRADKPSKHTAALMGVTPRSVTRWMRTGQGSPAHRMIRYKPDNAVDLYFKVCRHPWELAEYALSLAYLRTVAPVSDDGLIVMTADLLATNAEREGADNAARVRNVDPMEHADMFAADGTTDIKLHACRVEMAARRIEWRRVPLGGGR